MSKIFSALGAGAARLPAGIVVLERMPRARAPRLHPFGWCRGHPAKPARPAESESRSAFPLLMVGLARNGGQEPPFD